MSKELERVFSHAVALDQSGRMRNTIHCKDRTVFILNYDRTVLLKFTLDATTKPFQSPIEFAANDYDSPSFREENGKIVFLQSAGGFERKKSCGRPAPTPVERIWDTMCPKGPYHAQFRLQREFLDLLNEDLSHVEFSTEEGKLLIVQRDIFSGTVISLKRQAATGLKLTAKTDTFNHPLDPIGMRTNDLMALFTFTPALLFSIGDTPGLCMVETEGGAMKGLISWCVYDELGNVSYLMKEENHGRQEQEDRGSEQKADRTDPVRRRKI